MGGALASGVLFHLVTNLWAFATSSFYSKDFTGLAQALWTYPPGATLPTAFFFRQTCASALLFTALFIVAAQLPYFRKATLGKSLVENDKTPVPS